jgi:D-serine deaminase-like pyridoxal phosphate-dependent protein
MVARCGAKDILLAVQPVGPNIGRFFRLKQEFRDAKISCIADSEEIIGKISRVAMQTGLKTAIWLDINNGMNRTGILPDKNAAELFKSISGQPMLIAEGLHVYDGHIHEKDPAKRKKICEEAFSPVTELLRELRKSGSPPLPVVAGGTPTFPIHAGRGETETSPGTLLLWDYGYSSSFADLDFLHAAILLTRVVSKPGRNLICLDLGHKAVASEMPQPRIKFLGLDNYEIVGHNEEHMVVSTDNAEMFSAGDALYGIPWHICPTVDRYDTVIVIRDGRASEEWKVEARSRRITI